MARIERRSKTTSGDLLESMIRQDSPISGFVADRVAASQFQPDPKFDPLEPTALREAAKGLPEEYVPHLAKAVSAQHRIYLRSQLDDKLADQQHLSDMGFTGQAARFLAGLVEPTNLAIGLVAGPAVALKGVKGIAAGLGTGAAAGYGFERTRQAYNFEDSQSDAAWAGFMGLAFSAPFVGLQAREMGRVRSVARAELERDTAIRNDAPLPPVAAALDARAKELASEHTGFAPAQENAPVKDADAFAAHVPEQPKVSLEDPIEAAAAQRELPPAVQEEAVYSEPVQSPSAVQEVAPGKGTWWLDADGEPRTGTIKRVQDDHVVVMDDASGKAVRVHRGDLASDAPGHISPEVDGFLAGSVGGAQVAHTPVELTAMAKWRFDIFASLNKSANPVVQRLGKLFVKDAINPSEHYAQGRSVSEDKKLLQRTLAGNFHFEAASAYADAAQKLGYGWLEKSFPSRVRQFHEDVGRFMRDPAAFSGSPIQAELQRSANAARILYSTMAEEMQKAGVKGAETLAANPDYLNRVWLGDRIRDAAKAHGEPEVHRLVASAIRDKQPIIDRFRKANPTTALSDAEILARSSKKFLDSVMSLEYSHLSTELLMNATDAPTLRAELVKANLSKGQVESIIDHLFEVQEATSGDSGKPANLKYRFNLDEGAKITTEKGDTLRLSDLLENDARVLVDRYMNSMAGHVAMARQGIKSRADFMAAMREADQHHETSNVMSKDAGAYASEKQMLQDVYDHIVGRPMSVQSFNTGDRIASTMRAYGRSVYLGQLGFTAMMEAFHAASLMTWRAAIQQMPSLMEFVRATRTGQRASKGLAKDVTMMLGVLNEHVSGYLRQHEVTDFTYDRRLTKWENGANALSHGADKVSGNSFMTSLTRGMAAAGMIQKYANFAHGKKMTDAWRKRIVGSGINADDIDHVLAKLKDHVEMDGDRVVGVKWEDWSAKDPASYHDFVTAVDRDVRQGVQDHDLGETMYWQHTSMGKIFAELRAFNIAAHSKQFLNALHYRDAMSAQLFATSTITNALAYVVQTSMNYGHSQKELDKRLTAQRIAKAAWARSNMLGILPFLTDTVVPGFVTPFANTTGQGITANTDSRNVLMPPSFNLLAKAVNFGQKGGVKEGLTLLPFSNTYGARNVIDLLDKAYPSTQTPR